MSKSKILISLSAFLFFFSAAQSKTYAASVIHLQVEGVINPIVAQYIENGIKTALDENASAVLIQLDTPGGLLDTTRSINALLINADVPIIVYVGPRGARATSAGAFIMMAADIAAMAPETHIGAAHPVQLNGDNEKSSSSLTTEKAVSDSAAYIRTLATEHNRNAVWAEKAVRDSVSLTSEEAKAQNVIDILASSEEVIFKAYDGKTITKNGRQIIFDFKNVSIKKHPMSTTQRLMQTVAHPNIAYILMTIGIYGLIYELSSPGIGLGGAMGILCLLLAFFSMQLLPISSLGAILIAVGLACLILELFTPTNGLLSFGGLLIFALGSFLLIDIDKNPFYGRISIELIGSSLLATGLFFGFVVKKTLQAREAKAQVGKESLIGLKTTAKSDNTVYVNGEIWFYESDENIAPEDAIVVERVNGNKLFVKKI